MQAVRADDRLRVVAIVDVNEAAATKFKAEFELDAECFTSVEEMLAKIHPEVVVLALWTDLHLPVFRQCVDAGVRLVMCEKPMAARWTECKELAEVAENSKTLLTFCHQRRFAAGNQAARRLIDSGKLGVIERMDLFSPPHLLDCGTHSVDQALAFNRDQDVTWVHGAVDLSSTVNYFGIPAEAMTTGMFMFANGVFATIRTGTKDMAMWGGVRVSGSDGFVEVFWDGDVRRAVVYAEPNWTFCSPPVEPTDHMRAMVRHCVDCLLEGAEPEVSSRKALRAAEVLFGLYESARRHERIDLPLTGDVGNPLVDMLNSR